MKVRAVFDSDRGLRVEISAMTKQEQRVMGLVLPEDLPVGLRVPEVLFPVNVRVRFASHYSDREIECITLEQAGEATLKGRS